MENLALDAGKKLPTSSGYATPTHKPTLLRELRLTDAVVVLAGTVVGSGIFVVPNTVAHHLSSFMAVLGVWIAGGILSLAGALALGELGAAFPGSGGLYVYLRHAYGKPIGFLYGWSLLTLIHSGSIATLAVAFRLYVGRVLPLNFTEQKFAGFICVLLLTAINCLGVRSGKAAQYIFTAAKFGGLAAVIGALYVWGHISSLTDGFWPRAPFDRPVTHFGIALIGVLWAYEGWHVVSFAAGEFKNAKHDLPRGLFYGTLITVVAYILANIGYYCVLSAHQIAQTERVAATAVASILGGTAGVLVSVLILVAILGSLNGMILTGPRVYYAMAEDGLFFSAFARISTRFRVPVFGLLIQGVWSACMTLLGTFQELFTYVIFTAWIFYGLSVAAIVILRIRRPEIERSFPCPGYPWLPSLFVVSAIGVTLSTVFSSPLHALIGIGLVLTGLPVFVLFFAPSLNSAEAPDPVADENT